MRDAVNLARAGHPAILFVYGPFENAARAQAKSLGEADLNIYVVPQYRPGNEAVVAEQEKATTAAADFSRLLLGRS